MSIRRSLRLIKVPKLEFSSNKFMKVGERLQQAIRTSDLTEIRKIIKAKGISTSERVHFPYHGREAVNLIHIACALGTVEVVSFFLSDGTSLEIKTNSGLTPLHFAAMYNRVHSEVVTYLLDLGANITSRDYNDKRTTLHYACDSNNVGVVKVMLKNAQENTSCLSAHAQEQTSYLYATDINGKTPKQLAEDNTNMEIIQLFTNFDEEIKLKTIISQLPSRVDELERKTNNVLNVITERMTQSQTFRAYYHHYGKLRPPMKKHHTFPDAQGYMESQSQLNLYDSKPGFNRQMSSSTPCLPSISVHDFSRDDMKENERELSLHNFRQHRHINSVDRVYLSPTDAHNTSKSVDHISNSMCFQRMGRNNSGNNHYSLGSADTLNHSSTTNGFIGEDVNRSGAHSYLKLCRSSDPLQGCTCCCERKHIEEPGHIGEYGEKTRLHLNYADIRTFMKPEKVMFKLFSKMYFGLDVKQQISSLDTDFAKNDYILNNLIIPGSSQLFSDFKEILKQTNQEHVLSLL